MNKHKDVVNKQPAEVKEPTPAQPGFVKVENDKDVALEEKIVDIVGQHTEDPLKEHKEPEVAVKHSCGQCTYYDHSTEREFHRDGIRKGLVETRAICRAAKDVSKASGHLVKKESDRPCYVEGVYVKPVKEEKAKIPETPAPAETKKKTSKKYKQKHNERAVATNSLSGDTKVLTHKNGTNKVVVNNVGDV